MKSFLDQLSPTNRYYLGKLLKKAGKSLEAVGQGGATTLMTLTAAQLAQLENLLYFHQTISNQHASSESNLEQVTSLIFALLNLPSQPEPQATGFGQPSLVQEQLTDEGLVDRPALMQMPLSELIVKIDALHQGLGRSMSFVNDQEEELAMLGQTIQALQQQIAQSGEPERSTLEVELATEQQNYDFLEATLQGQRRRIQTEQQLLQIHQDVLRYRQEL